jgi:hypothetical protein
VVQIIEKVKFGVIQELINDNSFYLLKGTIMKEEQMIETVNNLVSRIWKASGKG